MLARAFMARAVDRHPRIQSVSSNAGNPASSSVNTVIVIRRSPEASHLGNPIIAGERVGRDRSIDPFSMHRQALQGTSGMTITIREIKRYPVKGLCRETLNAATVRTGGQSLPQDRCSALAHASSGFDRTNRGEDAEEPFPRPQPRREDRQLSVSFEPARTQLTLSRGGRQAASGNTEMPVGRLMLDQFFSGFTPAGSRGNVDFFGLRALSSTS